MLKSKSRLAIAMALVLAGAAPAAAGMSGIEWMQKWQPIEKRQSAKVDTTAPQTATSVNVGVRVVKVNVPGRELTISHGAVKKIGMPAMTMTFPVAETTHLKMLHKGDHVTIHVMNDGGVAKITGFKMRH